MFYNFSDDSNFLLKTLKDDFKVNENTKKLKVCEMGLGSGEVIYEFYKYLKQTHNNIKIFGFDINNDSIKNSKKLFEKESIKVNFSISDIFEKSNNKYDLIFFNTPYLPIEENENFDKLKIIDRAIYGGEKGYETTIRFLEELDTNLEKEGVCYILISTLTKPKIVEKKLKELKFKYNVLDKKNLFFEKLLIYKIER